MTQSGSSGTKLGLATAVLVFVAAVLGLATGILDFGRAAEAETSTEPEVTSLAPTPTPATPESPPAETVPADQDPPVSEPAASAPAVATTTHLVDLEAVDEYNDGMWDWDSGTVSINGADLPRALFDVDVYERSSITFDLGRDYASFEATAGVLDTSADGSAVRVEVYVDDRLAASADAVLGQSLPISVDVSGALRLRLELLNLDPDTVGRPDAGFGDAVLR